METKKVIIDNKEFEYVTKMEADEYETNETNRLEDTLDLGVLNSGLDNTIKIEGIE